MPPVRVKTQVKICGINSPAAYEAAIASDWVGFVFFPLSPRFVTPEQAAALIRPGGPLPVGLFVNPDDDQIAQTLAVAKLDVLQLVATTPIRAASVRELFGLPVWRAIGVANATDLPRAMDGADALLLDASAPTGSALPGGNAEAFDWRLLHDWQAPGPWVLAGGLTPANVAHAVALTGAPTVDVSSGVERVRGQKDPAMIAAFLEAVRSC